MRLVRNIDHIVAAPGIEAVLIRSGSVMDFRGSEEFRELLLFTMRLADLCPPEPIQIRVGDFNAVVQTEGREQAFVVVRIGAPIRKSLRRTLRRMAKRERRGPAAAQAPHWSPHESNSSHSGF